MFVKFQGGSIFRKLTFNYELGLHLDRDFSRPFEGQVDFSKCNLQFFTLDKKRAENFTFKCGLEHVLNCDIGLDHEGRIQFYRNFLTIKKTVIIR